MIPSLTATGAGLLPQAAALASEVASRAVRSAATPAPGAAGAIVAAAAAALPSAKKASASGKSRRSSGAGYAKAKGTSKGASSKKPSSSKKAATSRSTGALAFLDDPRLPIEEKLFRFMMYVQDRFDRDVEQKMKEAAGKATTSKATGSTKKKGGPFAKLAGALKTAFPGLAMSMDLLNDKNVQALVKTLGGPALAAGAAAMGFPGLAPVLAKAGPQVAGVAFDLAAAFKDAPEGTASSGGSTSTGTGSTGSAESPEIDRKKMMELQYAMEKQKEMFTLISNVLRSLHDMKMSAVHNIRS